MICMLVDDEPLLLRKLQRAAAEVMPDAEIHGFTAPAEALAFAGSVRVDIAFLDIKMRGMDGLELAKELVGIYPKTNILFCTGYSEYALDAFDAYASDYLLKPITAERIQKALGQLRHTIALTRRVKISCFGNFEALCDGNRFSSGLQKPWSCWRTWLTETARSAALRR